MKRFLALVLVLAVSFGAAATLVSQPALAEGTGVKNKVCQGIQEITSSTSNCEKGGTSTKDINSVIGTVVNLLTVVVGILAVVMLIYGGMKFIMSGGEASAVASAKKSIIFALVGLVIVGLAQVIVHFVLGNIVGI